MTKQSHSGEAVVEQVHEDIKKAIAVLRGSAARGIVINPGNGKWFEGYVKACSDIERMVVDRAFNGEPLPQRRRPNNERPG